MKKSKPKVGRPTGPPHSSKSIRLPDKLWEHIDTRAEEINVTGNKYVRQLIEADLGRSK